MVFPMRRLLPVLVLLLSAESLHAQMFTVPDPMLKLLFAEGTAPHSRVARMAQILTDSIGPRAAGADGYKSAVEWMSGLYREWGMSTETDALGTARGWRSGLVRFEVVAPRPRVLNAALVPGSAGTNGEVIGTVASLPFFRDSVAANAWLAQSRGRFVLMSYAEPTCWPDEALEELNAGGSTDRLRTLQQAGRRNWQARLQNVGPAAFVEKLQAAGAAGIITLASSTDAVSTLAGLPHLELGCEDYALLSRLVTNPSARLRLQADAAAAPDQPVVNLIARMQGRERAGEYVLLTAPFATASSGPGATESAAATATVLEAMRILRNSYPQPKRTIVAAHWGVPPASAQGANAFISKHPDIVRGLAAGFSITGAGKVNEIRGLGFPGPGVYMGEWLSRMPDELTSGVRLDVPGLPDAANTIDASFVCRGMPIVALRTAASTKHAVSGTAADTYDKILSENLRTNAILLATLAYQAAEADAPFDRKQRIMPTDTAGQYIKWPSCK